MNNKNTMIHKIGLWMDHAEAKLIDPEQDIASIRTIHSSASGLERIPGETSDGTMLGHFRSSNNESHKHRKEENVIREYFERLADQLKVYDEIFLFGPTTAAHEFNNYLLKEKLLADKKIHLEKSDYLTDPQLVKEVEKYFSTSKKKD